MGLIAFLTCLGIFIFHLAGLVLFLITFLITIACTGDIITALLAGAVAGLTGIAIQLYARRYF